jgi:uncharacterized Zn finger protein
MFNVEQIKQQASSDSYRLGVALYQTNQVSRLSVDDDTVTAVVSGRHDYRVSLVVQGDSIDNDCTCPAAAYQNFCKHCVAVALQLNNTSVEDRVNEKNQQKALQSWFKQKSVDELTDIVMGYVNASPNEQDKWQLTMRHSEKSLDNKELQELINKALPVEEVWDWHQVEEYFTHAETMFETILPAIKLCEVAQQWQLVLNALQLLNEVIEHIDDSGDYRYALEGKLKESLVDVFTVLPWSTEKKAQWLFGHYLSSSYDISPEIPGDFSLSDDVNQAFLAKCLAALDQRSPINDLSDWDEKWPVMRLVSPLVEQAKTVGDWQMQCRLLNRCATTVTDYLAISDVCLDNNAELEAEDWLRTANKIATTSYDVTACQSHEVKVRIALNEFDSAWRIAWQVFTEDPSFRAYQHLLTVQQQTGVIDSQLSEKVEDIFTGCYVENRQGFASNSDALFDFYMSRNELEKSRLWVRSHKARSGKLLTLANTIVVEHPQDAVEITYRAIVQIIDRTKNSAYQEALSALITLENNFKTNDIDLKFLYIMISKIIKVHKAKRNMMKLLKENFAMCF